MDDNKYELEHVLPCGDWLVTHINSKGERSYWLKRGNDYWPLWRPSKIHRTALLAAILKEDEYKFEELESTKQE